MRYSVPILIFAAATLFGGMPGDGLMFYYTFDDSTVQGKVVKERSGRGFDLTGSATPVLGNDATGKARSALLMDGTYYLSGLIPDSQVVAMTAGDFTFGCMVKTTYSCGNSDDRFDIAGMGDASISGFFASFNNNLVRMWMGNHSYYDSPTALNDGAWHFAVLTRSSGTATLYIDRGIANQGAYTGNIRPVSDSLLIGRHGVKNESYYKGLVDDVFFYKRALSSDEVFSLQKFFTGFNVTMIAPADSFTGPSPQFVWHKVSGSIAYAAEIDTSAQFTAPILSVPLQDTAFTVPKPLAARRYYVRIGCNFDDRSGFVFADPKPFIVH